MSMQITNEDVTPGVAPALSNHIPMDNEAREFIEAMFQWHRHRIRVVSTVGWALVGLQPVLWWLYFALSGRFTWEHWPVKLAMSLLFPPLIILFPLICLGARKKMAWARRDRDVGMLVYVEGRFRKGIFHTRYTSSEAFWLLEVEGARIYMPYRMHAMMSQGGEGAFVYFPHTQLCWTYNGVCVLRRGDFKFW